MNQTSGKTKTAWSVLHSFSQKSELMIGFCWLAGVMLYVWLVVIVYSEVY